jgi:hypothetical protein
VEVCLEESRAVGRDPLFAERRQQGRATQNDASLIHGNDGGRIASPAQRSKTEEEYKETILYRGTVTLWANHKQVGQVEVGEDGIFTFQDVTIKEGDKIYALISLPGGIFIRSLEQAVSAGGSCAARPRNSQGASGLPQGLVGHRGQV